ncbi:MAG: antitoxin family protein [Planctomycetes bacterium]|nr:antitoxin family protein [Planctomycetota bacterium]
MSQIEAIYRHGVFEPLGPVDLKEDQRVRLSIETTEKETIDAWLERVRALHAQILSRRGGEPLPDSTPGIAEDRLR